MYGEQIHIHFPPELFGVNSWNAQMIRQWIPDCWSGNRKCTGPNSWWHLADCRCWQPASDASHHAAVDCM